MRKNKHNNFKRICVWVVAVLVTAYFSWSCMPVYTAYAESGDEYESYDETYSAQRNALAEIVSAHDIYALIFGCTEYSVRTLPYATSDAIVNLPVGTTVTLENVCVRPDENSALVAWYKIKVNYEETEYSGFVERSNLAISDEDFLAWEEEYKMNPVQNKSEDPNNPVEGDPEGGDPEGGDPVEEPALTPEQELEKQILEQINLFPESYKSKLLELHAKHPTWIFVPYETGLDWQTVINNEVINKKSLVSSGYYGYHKEGYCEPGWYYAAENTVKWYMDPRAWLDEKSVFMFELLAYNSSYHSVAALDSFLNTSFMKSSDNDVTLYAPGTENTYAEVFLQVGSESNISPFHLASRVLQEQGTNGSPMVSGTYSGYEGYYNYFNIGATSGSSAEKLKQGLSWAKARGWINAYLSIKGGSELLASGYVAAGQDTVYLQKFNVTSNNTYGHQYMQNIAAPSSEAVSTYNLYAGVGKLDSSFVFKIPVYNNMPQDAITKPVSSTNIVMQLPAGYKAEVYVDGVLKQGIYRNGQYIIDAGNGDAKTLMMYAYTDTGFPAGTKFWTLNYSNSNYYEVTYQSGLDNLLIYHGFSIRITGNSGIRCISSFDEMLKKQMTTSSYNGYKLKEYGTLIMNNKYINEYPINYGSEKVQIVKAYDATTNNVYKTENGRVMYTAVLTDIPASYYKAELAFRSYAILEKNGKQYVFYGPTVARSIYGLASKYLELGTYSQGSSQYEFLSNIISTAE